jgi:hypothetical protein
MSQLPPPSSEQLCIIETAITLKNNIVVDAVAGSGKTTLCLHIASRMPGSRMLILTYNKDLKTESRTRAADLGLNNIEVHTYHSLCRKYYGADDYTDEGIKKSIHGAHLTGYSSSDPFRIIILDESQDVTDLLFQLFTRFYEDISGGAPIMLIGDKYQTIYQFKGADSRYLTRAMDKYSLNSLSWTPMNMHVSYRITDNIADFVNDCMLNEKRLMACKTGPKVVYACTNTFKKTNIRKYLNGYADSDIMLLSASIKSKACPVREFANALSQSGRKIYAPVSDDSVPDRRDMVGKIAVLTFHQSKGLERKLVLVFGFDSTYFEFYNKSGVPSECPNTLYVACTRAKEKLVVLHHIRNGNLPFLAINKIASICDVQGTINVTVVARAEKVPPRSVTQLCSHLSFDNLEELKKLCSHTIVEPAGTHETIAVKDSITVAANGERIETVSEITGTAVPMMFTYYVYGNLMGVLKGKCESIINDMNASQTTKEERLEFVLKNVSKFLEQANLYIAGTSGYVHKVNQIHKYKWMKPEQAREAIYRMKSKITESATFENQHLIKEDDYQIVGASDCVSNGVLWEFKFVDTLRTEHLLQLALYALMTGCAYQYRLYNIKTGELLQLSGDMLNGNNLDALARKLIEIKTEDLQEVSESEFLHKKELPVRAPRILAVQSELDMMNDL